MAFITVFSTAGSGHKTVTAAGTAEMLAANQPCKSVVVKALSTNTGIIYVGVSTVDATNGFELSASESVSIDISDLNKLYLDVSVSSEGVSYLWVDI